MVTCAGIAAVVTNLLLAQQPAENVMEQLDPPRRAAVVMALLALVLTGLLLVTIVMLGANWVRRMARHKPGELLPGGNTDAVAKNRPLRESLRPILPEAKSGDTVQMNVSSNETKIDT